MHPLSASTSSIATWSGTNSMSGKNELNVKCCDSSVKRRVLTQDELALSSYHRILGLDSPFHTTCDVDCRKLW